MEHNRFVIETMSFCQGNCSGCFFAEKERVGGSFMDSQSLTKVVEFIQNQAKSMSDVSINFGQGDHIAVTDSQWNDLMFHVKQFKGFNPLITITTSAIERTELVKKRTDELHALAIEEGMKLFFAVVLDPKKLNHKVFKDRYVDNIEYIRRKFGFIDLTINVGNDTLEHFSPEELSNFLLNHKFRHLELNLIPTTNTVDKFVDKYQEMIDWFVEFKRVSVDKPYLVFHHYNFNQYYNSTKDATIPIMRGRLQNWLKNNFYIDYDLKVSSIFSGFTGNAIPVSIKTGFNVNQYIESFNSIDFGKAQDKIANEMIRNTIQDSNCISCEFNKQCLMFGVQVFKNDAYKSLHNQGNCFIGVKRLWDMSKETMDKTTGVTQHLIPQGLIQENSFGIDQQ